MIRCNSIKNFSSESDEGKMLLAAIAILTSITKSQIDRNEFGGMSNPDDVIKKIADMSNWIYHRTEYEKFLAAENRDVKIDDILKN